MAKIALHRTDPERRIILVMVPQHLADTLRLDRVARRRTRAVGFDIRNAGRVDSLVVVDGL